jgi:hypothetical protein
MKGVYSSSDALMSKATQEALFPDNAYNVDSGGDPKVIPKLTFEDFKDFHSTMYHPSNSHIYFYGDDDPMKRLELMDAYLKDFPKLSNDRLQSTKVQYQKMKKNLRDMPPLFIKYPAEPDSLDDNSHAITVNWLLAEEDQSEMSSKDKLVLSILNHLLLGTSSSVLKKALTDSQLGESVTGGGLSSELIQDTFSVGMKGVKEANTMKIQELILSTLEEVVKTGFTEDAIRASLNSIEFDLREFNTGGNPKGLSLMLSFLSNWIYDRDPFEAVRFEDDLAEMKADLKAGKPIFQEMTRKYLLENGHRVTVVMVPDINLAAELLEQERLELQKVKDSMTNSELNEIVKATAELKAAQEAEDSPEAKATIPRLQISDLDPAPREIPLVLQKHSEPFHYDLLIHPMSTSSILYVDIGLDFKSLPLKYASLLPLFSRMLTEAGTTTRDQVALSHYIGAETGGVGVSWNTGLRSSPGKVKEDQTDVTLYLMLRGKCTSDKVDILFDIFSDILLNAKLDNKKRAIEMLLEVKARRINAVVGSGHSFGMSRLAAKHSFLGYLGEHTSGLTYLRSIDDLLEEMENDWSSVQQRLEYIRSSLLSFSTVKSNNKERDSTLPAPFIINLTGDEELLEKSKESVNKFLSTLKTVTPIDINSNNARSDKNMVEEWSDIMKLQKDVAVREGNDRTFAGEGISVPSQVNYVVKGGSLFQSGEVVKGGHAVVARYLGTGYLWDTVRVMGGAYGCFGRFSPLSGRFVFASYRDPNVVETLEVYDKAGDSLLQAVSHKKKSLLVAGEDEEVSDSHHYVIPPLSEEDITQSVIGFIGDLDSPLSNDQKGYVSMCNYIAGETENERTQWRREVLETSVNDFKLFAEKLKALESSDDNQAVVIGSLAALEKANEVLLPNKKLRITSAFSK